MNKLNSLRVLMCYKNFAAAQGVSHIGLGVSAINVVKCLQKKGVRAEILPMKIPADLKAFLDAAKRDAQPITHVIVAAPWVPTDFYAALCAQFPTIHFALNCHSNVGFLQADTNGIRLVREGLALETGTYNFHVAGNSRRFCRFIWDAYGSPCQYLPNLYFLDSQTDHHHNRPNWDQTGGVLRIGTFGATRTQKNFLTCIAAAIEISRELKAQTEVWLNTARDDGPETQRILRAGRELVSGLPNIIIREAPWSAWPAFRKIVGNMHLLISATYTESFHVVSADACAEGVASVVSHAITWVPDNWKADADDVFSIARTGVGLLHDHRAPVEGLRALKQHNARGMSAWLAYLLQQEDVAQI